MGWRSCLFRLDVQLQLIDKTGEIREKKAEIIEMTQENISMYINVVAGILEVEWG